MALQATRVPMSSVVSSTVCSVARTREGEVSRLPAPRPSSLGDPWLSHEQRRPASSRAGCGFTARKAAVTLGPLGLFWPHSEAPRRPPPSCSRGRGTHITAGILEAAATAVIFHKERLHWRRPGDGSTGPGFTQGGTATLWSPGPAGAQLGVFTVEAAPAQLPPPPTTGG